MGRQTEQAYRGVVQFVGQHSFLVPSKLYFYSTVVRRRGGGGLRGDRAEDDPGEASGGFLELWVGAWWSAVAVFVSQA